MQEGVYSTLECTDVLMIGKYGEADIMGMTVVQDEKQRSVWIGQPSYSENLLKKYGMQDCKSVSTAMYVSSKLVIASYKDLCVNQQLYQLEIGSLSMIYRHPVSTRPDSLLCCLYLGYIDSLQSQLENTAQHWNMCYA